MLLLAVVSAPLATLSYLLYSVVAALCALLCWPARTRRTRARMALAGMLTVLCVFAIIATIFVILNMSDARGSTTLLESASFFALVIALGSISTLGIPYLIAALLSQKFVEVDEPSSQL